LKCLAACAGVPNNIPGRELSELEVLLHSADIFSDRLSESLGGRSGGVGGVICSPGPEKEADVMRESSGLLAHIFETKSRPLPGRGSQPKQGFGRAGKALGKLPGERLFTQDPMYKGTVTQGFAAGSLPVHVDNIFSESPGKARVFGGRPCTAPGLELASKVGSGFSNLARTRPRLVSSGHRLPEVSHLGGASRAF